MVQLTHSSLLGPRALVNRGRQIGPQSPKKPQMDHWHSGCRSDARREGEQPRIQQVEQTNLMKVNTTRNVTSVVMLVILSPFLALAMLVSIKTVGIKDNYVLLMLLTLSSAVLSGINGFGRRTSTPVPLSTANARGFNPSQTSIPLSARSSNNA